jgi:hypothetical protein
MTLEDALIRKERVLPDENDGGLEKEGKYVAVRPPFPSMLTVKTLVHPDVLVSYPSNVPSLE